MTDVTELRALVAELRSLYAASTGGEWRNLPDPMGHKHWTHICVDDHGIPNVVLADVQVRLPQDNGAFIAAVHNALPRLLDALEARIAAPPDMVGFMDEHELTALESVYPGVAAHIRKLQGLLRLLWVAGIPKRTKEDTP